MKAVSDTGPLIWIERIGYGPELHRIYSTVWAPPGVADELQENWKNTAAIWPAVNTYQFSNMKDERRFNRIVNRWMRRHEYPEDERADVETIVLYREFVEADEVLYANKDAKNTFGKFGKVRDIYQVYETAMRTKVWDPQDAAVFLEKLITIGYRTDVVKKVLQTFQRKHKLS